MSEYWVKRAAQREAEAFARGAALTERIATEYQKAARSIRRQITDLYTRYGDKHGLSYGDAAQRLNRREFREWQGTLGDYMETIRDVSDPVVRQQLTAQLDALSTNSRVTRLQALETEIDGTLHGLAARFDREMRVEMGDLYTDSFWRKSYDLQMMRGTYKTLAHIDAATVERVISYPWAGATFSQRIWRDAGRLSFALRETLTQGLIRGDSVAAMSRGLSSVMGSAYKQAERLVRTEVAHFHNEADRLAYERAHIASYEFMAFLQERTCEDCGGLDGKRFKVSEAKEGVNYPPLHPNCRCTTVAVIEEEPGSDRMTWEEWKKRQKVEQGVDKTGKSWYNRREAGQYAAYQASILRDDLSALTGLDLYIDTVQSVEKTFIGMKTADGIVIRDYSKHFIDRVLGSPRQNRNGVELDDIMKALKYPTKIQTKKDKSRLYTLGGVCAVSVNPKTGVLIQTNPISRKKKG